MPGTHYIGKAGQFAIMAELSLRGYNVAIPEIDIGDDVFVVNHATGILDRIQVKTATGRRLTQIRFGDQRVYSCQFLADLRHVNDPLVRGSHYVFAARCDTRWRFLIFERGVLRHLVQAGWGTQTGNQKVALSATLFTSRRAAVSSRRGATDLSNYAGNWDAWPPL